MTRLDDDCGFRPYLKILRCLRERAQTIREVEASTGISYSSLRHMLPHLRASRLIGVKGIATVGRASMPIYGLGLDSARRAPAVCRPLPTCIALASLVRAMGKPTTVRRMNEETGVSITSLRRFIAHCHAYDLAHIREWHQAGDSNSRAPAWRWGAGEDAPKPTPLTRELINARYREPRKHKGDFLRVAAICSTPFGGLL